MELPAKRVEEFLHQRIPLSKAINCQVSDCSQSRITLMAPRFANTVEGSEFSDQAALTLGQLACWTLLSISLLRLDYKPELRLAKADWNSSRTQKPTTAAVTAVCDLPGDKVWQQCLRMLMRKAQANVTVTATLRDEEGAFATLSCEYEAHDLDPA